MVITDYTNGRSQTIPDNFQVKEGMKGRVLSEDRYSGAKSDLEVVSDIGPFSITTPQAGFLPAITSPINETRKNRVKSARNTHSF
jgi:hypothetical protein